MKKQIVFNLKEKWYTLIKVGRKNVEYREVKPYWQKRLQKCIFELNDGISANEWYAVFRNGYSKKSPDIVRRITKIDIGPVYGEDFYGCYEMAKEKVNGFKVQKSMYEGWDGNYYRIHFAKKEDQE